MSKLLIFNFDGTGNEPSDAAQDIDYKGAKEDDNITNVLKFHLMLGGDLLAKETGADYESSLEGTDQRVFYYHGIGTYGSRLKRFYNAVLSVEKSDVATILRKAKKDFKGSYEIGDKLLVTGFSRGSALARRFVALIEKDHKKKAESDQKYADIGQFVYEALYDTVASIGPPNMNRSDRPDSEVVFENGHSLPGNVIKALHCISMDDKRYAFQPTLMNYQKDVVHEIWFAGAHSDVGGGYYRDRLSDMVLEYYLQWISDNVPEARFEMPTEETLKKVIPEDVSYEIGMDDLLRNPSAFGKNHQQDRFFVLDWLTLTDRLCCVIENDKPTDRRPLVHWSVASRINGDGDYRPKSLKNKKHTIVYADGRLKNCKGLIQHIETPRSDLRYLEKPNGQSDGKTEEVTVFANQIYNHSGLMLEKGAIYRFSVKKDQKWHDGNITCGPEGWNLGNQKLGLKEVRIALMEPFRRVPDADWFCMCGCVTDNDDYAFEIGEGPVEIEIEKSGEFLPFANDKRKYYGNNEGKIIIVVQRIS
jgi:hypothetical protein